MKKLYNKLLVFLGFKKNKPIPSSKGLWQQLNSPNYVRHRTPENFSFDVLSKGIEDFNKGKNYNKIIPVKTEYVSPYIKMTREEVLNLRDGDVCYIESSYGMQKTTYPELAGDTHRNLFGPGGANKTIEQKRDFGPIYKKNSNGK